MSPLGGRGRVMQRVLLVVLGLATALVEVQAQDPPHRPVAAIDRADEVSLDGIRLNRDADVSVRRTSEALVVQIRHGEALLKAHEPGEPPVVVRAGNAQVRDFDAVVCVGMESNRASIDVIDGEARVGNVDAESHVINEVTLQAGNRAEITETGAVVSFRLGGSGVGQHRPCRWGMGPQGAGASP